MSKSLSQILIPASIGTSLVIGTAIGVANWEMGKQEMTVLEERLSGAEREIGEARAEASNALQRATDFENQAAAAKAMAESGGSLTAPAPVSAQKYGLGRRAHRDEIAAWDVDVLPDGRGLPEGSGDVWTGEEVFADQCGACHGDFAEGVDNWPVLAGGLDTLADKDPLKTVGSYWPYLSTVWDYVHRSMPFGAAQTLSDDDTYAIVAYILYSNDLVDDDFVLSHENFADFEMYNKDGFVIDDREELEYSQWRAEPCMSDCKDSVEITMRASVLNVTPEEEAAAEDASQEPAADASGGTDDTAALISAGENVFKKCSACHQVGTGAQNKSGPQLTAILGRTIGSVDGFNYSKVFEEAAANGEVWTEENLAAFLENPKAAFSGTKMSFAGLKKKEDQVAIIAYLGSFLAE